MWRIRRMNRGVRAGAGADLIRGTRMIAIGQQDLADAKAGHFFEICRRRLHGIDAEISARVENEVAVEIVAVRFRKPRPGEDSRQDLLHQLSPSSHSYPG